MRIETALGKFLLQLQADGRSVLTADQRRRHVLAFAAWLAAEHRTQDLGRITHEVVAEFMVSPAARSRRDGGIKRATSTNQLRTSLRCFFGYCEEAGLVRRSPAKLLKLARCSSRPPTAITDAECRRLFTTLSKSDDPRAARDHALFHLLRATGARIGAALALAVADVDFRRREIALLFNKNDSPTTVPINDALRRHLRAYIGKRREGPLFLGRDGQPMSGRNARARLRIWAEKAGIDRSLSPHAFRHALGMDVYRRTGDLLLTQAALGHRAIASTTSYARADTARVRAALA